MHKYLLHPDVRSPDEPRFSDFLKGAPKLPRSVDYRVKMPPIWDQGQLGACQSYAIDAIDQFVKEYSFTPSHLFTYYNVRLLEGTVGEDSGGTLSDTCKAVKQYGICDAVIWPNDNAKFAVKPTDAAYKDGKAGDDALTSFYRAQTVNEAREALALGHLPYIGIRVYENFESGQTLSSGIIPAPKGQLLGGHALVIVGYQDDVPARPGWWPFGRLFCRRSRGYFIVRNSWGTGIGLDGSGYFQMDYAVFEKLLMDMWIIVQ